MKISKFLVLGLAAAAVTVSSCDIAKPYEKISGVDKSKAKPTELTLDEDNSSSTGISVYWNGSQAVSAGALAFTCQLVDEYGGAGDNYDKKMSKHMSALDDVGNVNDAASFTSLSEGKRYFVRVRADYAYSVCSEWVYLEKDGVAVQVSVGNGFVISEFVAPQDLKAEALTYSSISLGWGLVGPADGYEISYKKESDSDWTVSGKASSITNSFIIKGLEESTSYNIRVRAYRDVDGVTEWTEYAVVDETITTPMKPPFDSEITTAEQLQEFLATIASQASETDSYKIMNDIDMSGITVTAATDFAGTLDGQNKSIKNLDLNGSPMFTKNSGKIMNMVIDASCTVTAIPGYFGIIASENAGTVEGCTNNAAITLGDYDKLTYLGGIVGYSTGLVKDCTNNGNITISASTFVANSMFAGVAGCFSGTAGTDGVTGCKNTGNIIFDASAKPSNPIIAGVVGGTTPHSTGKNAVMADRKEKAPNVGLVSNCTNTGKVTAQWPVNDSGSYTNMGGVVGYIEGDVFDCTNEGDIKLATNTDPTTANTRPSVGGVAGYIFYSAKNLTNKGKVSVSGAFAAGTDGATSAGAMMQPCFGGVIGGIGYCYAALSPLEHQEDETMENCNNYGVLEFKASQKQEGKTRSNTGAVAGYCSTNSIKNCHNYGEALLASAHYVPYQGGIVALCSSLSIEDCTNEGTITFSGRASEYPTNLTNKFSYQTYSGGIVGYIYAGCAFKNCENKGEIKFTDYISTAVLNYLGGIVGSYSGHCTMDNCKNSADITSTANCSLCLGGLAGAFNGNVNDCTNTGKLDCSTNSNASGKETEVGGLVGYANLFAKNCSNTGDITTATTGTYAGGLFGGWGSGGAKAPYADLIRQVEDCTADCSITGQAGKGFIAGRFRSKDAKHYLYYRRMTIGANLAGLPACSNLNGDNYIVDGDAPLAE